MTSLTDLDLQECGDVFIFLTYLIEEGLKMAVASRVGDNKVIPIRKGIISNVKEHSAGLPNQAFVCANCGYGSAPGIRWQPVMEASSCPMCGSQEKR